MSKYLVTVSQTITKNLEINAPDAEEASNIAFELADPGNYPSLDSIWDDTDILDHDTTIENVEEIGSELELDLED